MSKWTHTTYKYAFKKNGSWSIFCLKKLLFKTTGSLSILNESFRRKRFTTCQKKVAKKPFSVQTFLSILARNTEKKVA